MSDYDGIKVTPNLAINEKALPPQLRRIVRAIGLPAAIALLQARGGIRLYLPKRPTVSRMLVAIIGRDAAQALVQEFTGDRELSLPKADKILTQMRDAAILGERARGDSISKLALRYRLTRRTIQNIVKYAAPAKTVQGDLFAKAG